MPQLVFHAIDRPAVTDFQIRRAVAIQETALHGFVHIRIGGQVPQGCAICGQPGISNDLEGTPSKGDIFGEMALIDHTTRSATAKARTASKVAIVDQRRFLWLVQETPVFSRQVMGVMADRIRKLDKVLSSAWFPMTLVIESRYSPDA